MGYPGFVTKFRVAQTEQKPGGGPGDSVDYENYRHVCHKWHYKIAKALVVCLESKDYVQIRNALTILFKILGFFPMLLPLAGVIERRIEKVWMNRNRPTFQQARFPLTSILLCFRWLMRKKINAWICASWREVIKVS